MFNSELIKKSDISSNKFVIYSHFSSTGATEELRDWLNYNHVRELIYFSFPFGQRQKTIDIFFYKNGKLEAKKTSWVKFNRPFPISFLKDFLLGIYYGFLYAGKADWFIGGDNLLTICGIILKKIRNIKNVIYYMIDYSPIRYSNPVLNSIYFYFDRTAAYGCSQVWTLTKEMIQGRFNDNKMLDYRVKWQVVPYGNHSEKNSNVIHSPSILVYMGDVIKSKGAELLLPLAQLLRSNKLNFTIEIIGSGDYLAELKKLIAEEKVESYFHIYGYIEDFDKVLLILQKAGIALAPYNPNDPNNFSYFSDPGKVKVYLGCGLPIVITDVPPIAKMITQKGAGRISNYNPESILEEIQSISMNYNEFYQNALHFGKEFNWDIIFNQAFNSYLSNPST